MSVSHDAGRELDALIAEQVMGWHEKSCANPVEGSWWWDKDGPVHPTNGCGLDGGWCPSKNIAAAWEVVEKLAPRFWARIESPFTRDDGAHTHTGYNCGFTPLGTTGWNGRADFSACDATAPLAICRAALKAVETL